MGTLETTPFWSELVSLKDQLSLRELSVRFGVSPGAISTALRRTGTPRSPNGETLPPEPAAVGAPVSISAGRSGMLGSDSPAFAWRVLVEDARGRRDQFAIIAACVVDAARIAERTAAGRVVEFERIGALVQA